MDDRLTRIEDSLIKVTETLHSVDKTLVKQEENLREHMRRTELAENNISSLRAELEPVKKHVLAVNTILKFFGALSLGAGLILTLINIMEKF